MNKSNNGAIKSEAEEAIGVTQRQHWLAVLARTPCAALEAVYEALRPVPHYRILKPAENGAVMVRGAAGGSGKRFNLAEATVTRCVIDLDGIRGVSYALGRDRRKAELAALFDAMLQSDSYANDLQAKLVQPQFEAQKAARMRQRRKAAATKVDFFTMVRGE